MLQLFLVIQVRANYTSTTYHTPQYKKGLVLIMILVLLRPTYAEAFKHAGRVTSREYVSTAYMFFYLAHVLLYGWICVV